MKNLVKMAAVAIVLFGTTLTASAGVTGSDPRPAVVRTQGVTGSAPRPAAGQPVTVWSVVLADFGF